jgi:hypothetical protein
LTADLLDDPVYQNVPEYPPALLGNEWPPLSPGGHKR